MKLRGNFISQKYNILGFPLIEGDIKIKIDKHKISINIVQTGFWFTGDKLKLKLYPHNSKHYTDKERTYKFYKKHNYTLYVGKYKDMVIGIYLNFKKKNAKDSECIKAYYVTYNRDDCGEIYLNK